MPKERILITVKTYPTITSRSKPIRRNGERKSWQLSMPWHDKAIYSMVGKGKIWLDSSANYRGNSHTSLKTMRDAKAL